MFDRLSASCRVVRLGKLVLVYSIVILRLVLHVCASSEPFVAFSFWLWCCEARQEAHSDPSGGVLPFLQGADLRVSRRITSWWAVEGWQGRRNCVSVVGNIFLYFLDPLLRISPVEERGFETTHLRWRFPNYKNFE